MLGQTFGVLGSFMAVGGGLHILPSRPLESRPALDELQRQLGESLETDNSSNQDACKESGQYGPARTRVQCLAAQWALRVASRAPSSELVALVRQLLHRGWRNTNIIRILHPDFVLSCAAAPHCGSLNFSD